MYACAGAQEFNTDDDDSDDDEGNCSRIVVI